MIEYTELGIQVDKTFIPYVTIDRERNKIRFANHVLVTLEQPYARDDYVDVFIMERTKWEEWKAAIVKADEIYIGEIAGKHSQVVFYARNIKSEETDLNTISEFYAQSGWGQWDMNVLQCLQDYLEDNPDED